MNHSTLYKMNPEYRKAVASQLAKIDRTERQNALKSIPKGWRFVVPEDVFYLDDKFCDRDETRWVTTGNSYYNRHFAYITSRPLVQPDSTQETFADYKAEAEKIGLEVHVEHNRYKYVEDFESMKLFVFPKGGRTIVSLIKRSGELVGFGEAICSDSDNYCKEKGRLLAIRRALELMKEREQANKGVQESQEANSELKSSEPVSPASSPFKVGDYVNWKGPNSNYAHGPKRINSIPQPGVFEIVYIESSDFLDVCKDKIWLAGTPEPDFP
jgi:hypothetical protein